MVTFIDKYLLLKAWFLSFGMYWWNDNNIRNESQAWFQSISLNLKIKRRKLSIYLKFFICSKSKDKPQKMQSNFVCFIQQRIHVRACTAETHTHTFNLSGNYFHFFTIIARRPVYCRPSSFLFTNLCVARLISWHKSLSVCVR